METCNCHLGQQTIFQSFERCKMPVGFDFVRVLQDPAFTKETLFTRLTGNLGSSLMKVFRAPTKHFKTESWRKVNLPCDREI